MLAVHNNMKPFVAFFTGYNLFNFRASAYFE